MFKTQPALVLNCIIYTQHVPNNPLVKSSFVLLKLKFNYSNRKILYM